MWIRKIVFLSALVLMPISGCSWVRHEYIYSPSQQTAEWHHLYTPGTPSRKNAGLRGRLSVGTDLSSTGIEVIHDAYSKTILVGPLWFAILPNFGQIAERELNFELKLTARAQPLSVDITKSLILIDSKQIAMAQVIILPRAPVNIAPYTSQTFAIKIPVPPDEVSSVQFNWHGIDVQGSEVVVPPLILKKDGGAFLYEQFTL